MSGGIPLLGRNATAPRALCSFATVLFVTGSAMAQERAAAPSAALLVHDAEAEPFARMVRARVAELGVAEITTAPRLSLRDLQLSVECLNESTECLDAVARLLEVDGLLRVEVRSQDDRRAGVLQYHSVDGGVPWRTAARELASEMTLLASADGLVREVFGLPQAEEPPVRSSAPDLSVDEDGPSAWPFVIGGAALAAAAAGAVLGLLARDNHREWESAAIDSPRDADRAIDTYEAAETQARWANVAFVTAGALALVATAWLVIDLSSGDEEQPILVSVGPGGATLTWTGELPWPARLQ